MQHDPEDAGPHAAGEPAGSAGTGPGDAAGRVSIRRPLSPERYLQATRWALWSLTVIVVTGAAVRLTGSGLGCSDWPSCTEDSFVADLEYHAMIEFVNRLFTGVVALAVIVAVLGSFRRTPRRRDLSVWSLGLVFGVLAQVVLGALLVRTELDPRFTMGHFLLSMVLLWNAVVLHHRAAEPADPPGTDTAGTDTAGTGPIGTGTAVSGRTGIAATAMPVTATAGTVTADDRSVGARTQRSPRAAWLVRLATALAAVVLVSGTVVTGSGPHSGSDHAGVAERLPFAVREATRVHSILALGLVALVLAVWWHARRSNAPAVERRAAIAAALLATQAAVGYWQYFAGVPVLLVGVHVTLASLTWINIVRLHLHSPALRAARAAPVTAQAPTPRPAGA